MYRLVATNIFESKILGKLGNFNRPASALHTTRVFTMFSSTPSENYIVIDRSRRILTPSIRDPVIKSTIQSHFLTRRYHLHRDNDLEKRVTHVPLTAIFSLRRRSSSRCSSQQTFPSSPSHASKIEIKSRTGGKIREILENFVEIEIGRARSAPCLIGPTSTSVKFNGRTMKISRP